MKLAGSTLTQRSLRTRRTQINDECRVGSEGSRVRQALRRTEIERLHTSHAKCKRSPPPKPSGERAIGIAEISGWWRVARKEQTGNVRSSSGVKWNKVAGFLSWPVEQLGEPLNRKTIELGDADKRGVVMLEV
jgi:hypothetical protein